MEWQTVLVSIHHLDTSIVVLTAVLAVLFTYVIYLHFDTGVYTTPAILLILLISGLTGHVIFMLCNVFFSHDPGRDVIIGATIAMAIVTAITICILKMSADTVYSRYDEKKAPNGTSKGTR